MTPVSECVPLPSSLSSTPLQVPSPLPSEPLPSTMRTTTSISSINTTLSTPLHSTITTMSLQITSNMISSPFVLPTSAAATNSPQLPPSIIAAIVGGTAGAVMLLAFLAIVVVRCRSNQNLFVTPFNLLSTAEPTLVESQAGRLRFQSTGGAVCSSKGPPLVHYSDACLEEYSGNLLSDTRVDRTSSHLPNDYNASAFIVDMLQLERARELDKLYPIAYPSHIRTPDHYCHHSEENWFDQMVTKDCSREPSEELPAYPRSAKSLKSREADRDNRDGFPSSYP